MKLPLAKGKYSKPAITVGKLLAFSAVAIWFSYILLWTHYDNTRARVPDVAAGRVIVQNTHGHRVYLTAEEHSRLDYLEIAAVVLFLAGFLIIGFFADGEFRITRRKGSSTKPWEMRRW